MSREAEIDLSICDSYNVYRSASLYDENKYENTASKKKVYSILIGKRSREREQGNKKK